MPKNQNKNHNEIAAVLGGLLDPKQRQQLLELIDTRVLLQYLKTQGWDYRTELEELLRVARQNDNPTAKLKAIEALRQRMDRALAAEGMLVHAVRSINDGEGGKLTFSTDLVRASLPITKTKGTPNAETRKHRDKDEGTRAGSPTRKRVESEPIDGTPHTHRGPDADVERSFPGLAGGA